MQKINTLIVILAIFLTAGSFLAQRNAMAENQVTNNVIEVIHDEGYGNADAEYYNSEDDQVNDEELSSMENETVENTDSLPTNSVAHAQ